MLFRIGALAALLLLFANVSSSLADCSWIQTQGQIWLDEGRPLSDKSMEASEDMDDYLDYYNELAGSLDPNDAEAYRHTAERMEGALESADGSCNLSLNYEGQYLERLQSIQSVMQQGLSEGCYDMSAINGINNVVSEERSSYRQLQQFCRQLDGKLEEVQEQISNM